MIVRIQYCVDGIGEVIRIQSESKMYYRQLVKAGQYFERVEQNGLVG